MKRPQFNVDQLRANIATQQNGASSLRAFDDSALTTTIQNTPDQITPSQHTTTETNIAYDTTQDLEEERVPHPVVTSAPDNKVIIEKTTTATSSGEVEPGTKTERDVTNPPETSESIAPETYEHEKRVWAQNISCYASDDAIVERLRAYVHPRRRELRLKKKIGFSLYARAGLRALEDLVRNDPAKFQKYLQQAIHEQY